MRNMELTYIYKYTHIYGKCKRKQRFRENNGSPVVQTQ
jgi:hypothetical protein